MHFISPHYINKMRDPQWMKYLTPMYKMDFDGWWTDSTEPDHINNKPSECNFTTLKQLLLQRHIPLSMQPAN
jgi:alpha-glucosidase (family GH31 glycosyl hydrolase)